MLKARKKLAALAVMSAIGGVAMMSATPAQAVNVAQNGLGQVLYFPYYTAKAGLDTLFSVTNTTNRTAAIKIRFREALNSREVRDFNVVLSPYDVWTGGVTSILNDTSAAVRTFDNTCTSPNKDKWTGVDVTGDGVTDGYQVAFTNDLFTGANADGATADISRVREGYFEVFLMGLADTETHSVAVAAKHGANGVPASCATVDAAFGSNLSTVFSSWTAPENILKGHVTYINVGNGQALDAEATALQNWRQAGHIMSLPGDLTPSLRDGNGLAATNGGYEANVIADGTPVAVDMQAANVPSSAVNAASVAMMATSVMNEYVSGGPATSWVVTFPTKHYYTDPAEGLSAPLAPFASLFGDDGTAVRSCDVVSIKYYNREEAENQGSGTQFSPVTTSYDSLCYEANVIDFNGSSIFGSGVNHLALDTTGVGNNGWLRLSLTNANSLSSNPSAPGVASATAGGLPVIGFAAIMRNSGADRYGSVSAHAYTSGVVAQ